MIDVESVLQGLLERLSSIEHDRWSHWQKYMHTKCIKNADGSLTIPVELVEQWSRQSEAPYNALSDVEKQSDREQVQKYLPTISAALKASLSAKS